MQPVYKVAFLTLLVALALVSPGQAQNPGDRTINFDITDKRPAGVQMQMSLPLSMITSMTPQIEEVLENSMASLRDSGTSFQAFWNEVRDMGASVFIDSESLKVMTTDTELVARVFTEGTIVETRVSLAFGDVLFSQGNVDVDAIVEALAATVGTDIIRISGPDMNGRVWVE